VERSITQGQAGKGTPNLNARDTHPATSTELTDEDVRVEIPPDDSPGFLSRLLRNPTVWGLGLVLLCLVVYGGGQPNRSNTYLHFVLQGQAWLDGNTNIPTPAYQDTMPIGVLPDGSSCLPGDQNPDCVATGYSILPFPPLPAWVLLPFVALWHAATNEQFLAAIFAAIDVGIAFWMLGYLAIRRDVRVLTALFLGLGTVLWYAAAIGSTWFWAHVVAVGCLLLSVGLALSADRDAAEPEPVGQAIGSASAFQWPGGLVAVGAAGALGAATGLMFVLAGAGAPAASLAAVGVIVGLAAVGLAAAVARRPGVLGPFAIAVAVVGGVVAVSFALQSPLGTLALDAVAVVLAVGVWLVTLRGGSAWSRFVSTLGGILSAPESRQVAAGILFGLAVTARLTILFGFPFLMFVGGGGNWLRRTMLAAAGAAVPLAALLVVTYATSGHLFNPAYDYLYHNELAYPLNYHADWSISDVRYIPQNLMIMLFGMPDIMSKQVPSGLPGYGAAACVATTVRGLFDPSCPLAAPGPVGMSILLTSPAFLLAPLAWRPLRRLRIDRVTAGATVAVLAIATVNLMHFSQGWVQFGYRFSNDFIPFALVLVALGASRLGRLWPVVLLVALSIVVNLWGTVWGVSLGW